VPPPQEA
jgi:hypothetical protein